MKKDFLDMKLFSAAAIAVALCAGPTFAADLSSGKGPRTSLPLWTGFHSNSGSGYAWVAGDTYSAHSYEVRAKATIGVDPNAALADTNAKGPPGYDYRLHSTFLLSLGVDPRERAFLGSDGLRLPIETSVVAAERSRTSVGKFTMRVLTSESEDAADGAHSARDSRLGGAMLSTSLVGNPFLTAGHVSAFTGVGHVVVTPIGWRGGGDRR